MKPHSAFFCRSEETVRRVYTPEQIAEIGSLTELRSGVFDENSLGREDLSDVELIFSTWGMPSLSEEQLALLPKLKAVFYAAGATDSFARPFFARDVKVLSAWLANAIPVAEFCAAQIVLALKGYFRNTRMISVLVETPTVKIDGTLMRMFCLQRALSRLTAIWSGRSEM